MKHLTTLLACTVLAAGAFAKGKEKEAEKYNPAGAIAIGAGGTFGKAKIVPKLERLAIPQFSVNYKQATTVSVTKLEKKFGGFGAAYGKAATGSVAAYLETTDGELTPEDFQEITDYGYGYFQRALKKAGIDTVAWSKVVSGDFYKEGKEEAEDDRDQEQNKGQWWTRANAFHGNTIYAGKPVAFAFGKIKRASRYAKELEAPTAYINTTVDFADILVDVDVQTRGYRSTWTPSYNTIGETTKMKSNTSVAPFMKVPVNAGLSLFWNEKDGQEMMNITKDIPAEMNYSDGISEDPDRAAKRSRLFSVSFSHKLESAPVVISTTKEKYKAAAKKALEAFADAFVAKVQELKS